MSHLGPLARTLVGMWLVVWVGALGLYARHAVQGRVAGHMLLVASPERPDGFPTIRGIRPAQGPFDALVAGEPRPAIGDRVLRVGDTELRGAGLLRFQAVANAETGPDLRASFLLERDGEVFETWVEAWRNPFRGVGLVGLGLGLAGLFLVIRAPRSRAARFLGTGSMAWGLAWIPFDGPGPAWQHYAGFAGGLAASLLSTPLLLTGLLFFPDEVPPRSRVAFALPWLLGLMGAVGFAGLQADLVVPVFTGRTLSGAVMIIANSAGLGLLTWNYRRATPVGRRRIKWVVFGFYLALLPYVASQVAWLVEPRLLWVAQWGAIALLFIPVALLISIVRFNLFDIDRLISGAAAYTLVGIALLAGLLTALPPVAGVIGDWAGIETELSQVVLALVVAGIAIPVAERLRPHLDRVLFADRYRFEQSIGRLIERLANAREPRELIGLAGQQLTDLLLPESCVVYAGVEHSYAPVFVEGRVVPPAFEAGSPLIVALQGRRAPLSLCDAGRRPDEALLGPFDRAGLETLGAEVVVPVRQGDALAAFMCLGPKRSGDVYTSTDLSLLTAVAGTVSQQLRRFGQEDVTREAQEMQESLRRYVPGAIAEQLASGGDLTSSEREVTVLFVDIRGYTGFSESRKAEEIFSTVNRYTEAVSQLVQEHGGSVVEFNGDGMMAVFGAPWELAHKERAAVEAGREIVAAVGALRVEDPSGGETRLAVGVGIATGEAFVGNIQAVDRMIWSAIGNTTNLAARLQSLTRELDASLIIDATTRERAEAAAADFEKRPEVSIRGRREAQDLYALPMRENPGRLD